MSLALDLRNAYFADHPRDAARTLEKMPDAAVREALAGIDAAELTAALEQLATGRAGTVFRLLDLEQRSGVLRLASPRLALLLLGNLDGSDREDTLAALPPALRQDLERLRQFDENSAGRLMELPLDSIKADMSVAEALQVIRGSDFKRLRSFYVVDDDHHLVGRVDMQDVALADPSELLSDILVPTEGAVPLTAKREEIVEQLDRYRVDSIPVVDVEGRLMGVVRYRRLFEAIESVATADLQKMVGASADERALSSAMYSVRKRLPWLHINLLTAFLAAAVVGLFENLIAQFTALAVLLPVVAGQSGNAGSQALAVTIRGLALREVGTREWRRVLSKEVQVGVVDGLALAVTCGLGVFLWSQSLGLALVIGVAMILSMIAAGVSGALVPMVLTRLGQDPATASSIILTTVTDVAGFFSFLGTATLLSFML
jgi:magnesium transporter